MARSENRKPLVLADANGSSNGVKARVSEAFAVTKRAAASTAEVSGKIMKSTGKAAWITLTTFLVLALPLIIEYDREQQLSDLDAQQAALLGGGSGGSASGPHSGV